MNAGNVETTHHDPRLSALWRFAISISIFNVLGHLWLGFEQAWALPFVSIATGYSVELLLGGLDASAKAQRPRYLGGGTRRFVEFLLAPHITSVSVARLLYPNRRLLPVCFATAAAIASKYVFRVAVDGRTRHFFNPSNLGISVTLVALPAVGLAPPYMFSENLFAVGDWLLPALMVAIGSLLNARLTKRIPLILAGSESSRCKRSSARRSKARRSPRR
ncbi:MAG TPA: hypothetical protein VN783_06880 [Thermoanaerobaculia bacterium]|nr:hypothetical protein [Thermoanaerobaculia bacterium]